MPDQGPGARRQRHLSYRWSSSGRRRLAEQAAAIAAGRSLDLDEVRRLSRLSDLWQLNLRCREPLSRPDLLHDLEVLARFFAAPFLLGDFSHSGDIARIATVLANAAWIQGPDARPARLGTMPYGGGVLHRARGTGDTQINQPDDQFGTVLDGLLEFFFDWVLPLARVNGAVRSAALARVQTAYSDIKGAPKKIITDNMKGVGGKDINDLLEPDLQQRDTTEDLIAGVVPDPSPEVMARFWEKLFDLTEKLATAGQHDEAALLRQRILQQWGEIAPKDERDRVPDGDEPPPRSWVLIEEASTLDYLAGRSSGRAADKTQDEDDEDGTIRRDQVDDALDRLGQERKVPDLGEYRDAYTALISDRRSSQLRVPDGMAVLDAGVDEESAELAFRCLREAVVGGFVASQSMDWRGFVRGVLDRTGGAADAAVVHRASCTIMLRALQNRPAAKTPGSGSTGDRAGENAFSVGGDRSGSTPPRW